MRPHLEALGKYKHSNQISSRKISEEILLVPIRTSPQQKLGIYTLNHTASVIWELFDGNRNLSEVIDAISDRFEVDQKRASTDVKKVCRDLLRIGAIEAVEQDLNIHP